MLALLALLLAAAVALRFVRATAAPLPRPATTMAVLGSGGHTAEMLRLLRALPARCYGPLYTVLAHSDRGSLAKLRESAVRPRGGSWGAGRRFAASALPPSTLTFCLAAQVVDEARTATVYRAREVGQSYLTSVFTTLRSLADAVRLVFRIRPDLVLANGPGVLRKPIPRLRLSPGASSPRPAAGICVPLAAAALLLRALSGRPCKVVFVESVCRVRTLSLTGKLLYPVADAFVVQWPDLQRRYPRARLSQFLV